MFSDCSKKEFSPGKIDDKRRGAQCKEIAPTFGKERRAIAYQTRYAGIHFVSMTINKNGSGTKASKWSYFLPQEAQIDRHRTK